MTITRPAVLLRCLGIHIRPVHDACVRNIAEAFDNGPGLCASNAVISIVFLFGGNGK